MHWHHAEKDKALFCDADLGEEVLTDVEGNLQAQLVRQMRTLEHSPRLGQAFQNSIRFPAMGLVFLDQHPNQKA